MCTPCEFTKVDLDPVPPDQIIPRKGVFDDDTFRIRDKQPCWFMLPVYSLKGQVSGGALLFVVNTKKSKNGKESSKTEHGGEHY